ncbi:MAG: ribonuclease P protein component, partial [Pseudomonadota bacterium]
MAKSEASEPGVVRLKTRPQFLFVRAGKSERRKALVVQARTRTGSETIGAGFTATKKIGWNVRF